MTELAMITVAQIEGNGVKVRSDGRGQKVKVLSVEVGPSRKFERLLIQSPDRCHLAHLLKRLITLQVGLQVVDVPTRQGKSI